MMSKQKALHEAAEPVVHELAGREVVDSMRHSQLIEPGNAAGQ
jgi:hypothetical protein